MQRQTCTTIVDIPTCWLHILLILQPHSKAAKLILLHRNHLLVQSFSAKLSVFLCSLRVRTSSYVYIIPLRSLRFNLTSRIIIFLPKSDTSYIPRTFCFYLWNSRSFSKTNILPDNHRLLALGHFAEQFHRFLYIPAICDISHFRTSNFLRVFPQNSMDFCFTEQTYRRPQPLIEARSPQTFWLSAEIRSSWPYCSPVVMRRLA